MDWRVNLFVCLLFCCLCEYSISNDPTSTDTIYEVLQRTRGLSKFESLVRKANLVEFFQYPTVYTMFAPNDTAYEDLTADRKLQVDSLNGTALQNFIKFHVIEGQRLLTGDFQDQSERRSMSSHKLYLNRREGSASSGWFGPSTFFVNGAMVSPEQKDLVGNNGVVHGLMIWIDPTSLKTAYQYTLDPDNLKVKSTRFYNEILNKLSISGQYNGPIRDLQYYDGKLTLFVPTDEAINRIPEDILRNLQQDVQKLHEVVRAHYIKTGVFFTTYVNHNAGFHNANQRSLTIRKPYDYKVFVNSDGVTAEIVMGNVTVNNGVIHMCDRLLGYVYNTVRQQIAEDSPLFDQMINRAPEETRKALVEQSGVNVIVPTTEAFSKISNVPWASLATDISLVDKVLKLSILEPGQYLQVASLVGEYESRQYRRSLYYEGSNPLLTIYRQRNETWVQGDTVIGKVTRADIECKNGMIQYVDTILGIPYLDMANLICSDLWLLRTYDYLRALGMKRYLTDRRFLSKECLFETQGYPPNYGINNNYNGYVTLPPWTQVPSWDMGYCQPDPGKAVCDLTFFVPNSTAIDYFSNTHYGQRIMRNAYAFQRLLTRLLFRKRIELENLGNTNYVITSIHGDNIRLSKINDRYVTLYYGTGAARVIHMDNGATNGLVHIIDQILYVPDDLELLSAGASHNCLSFMLIVLITALYIFR